MSTLEDAFPKTPDAVRQERTNDLLTNMLAEIKTLNKNLTIMGQAMIKLADALMEPEPEPKPLSKGKKNVSNKTRLDK